MWRNVLLSITPRYHSSKGSSPCPCLLCRQGTDYCLTALLSERRIRCRSDDDTSPGRTDRSACSISCIRQLDRHSAECRRNCPAGRRSDLPLNSEDPGRRTFAEPIICSYFCMLMLRNCRFWPRSSRESCCKLRELDSENQHLLNESCSRPDIIWDPIIWCCNHIQDIPNQKLHCLNGHQMFAPTL